MKLSAFLFLAIIMFAASCKPKKHIGPNGVEYTSALQYNDYIIGKQKAVVMDMTNYGKAAQINADSAEGLLNSTINNITHSLGDITGMPAYNGDSSFRDAAIELFSFYKKSFSTDFKEMLEINRKIEKDSYTDSDIERFKQIEENIGRKESPLDAKLKDVQTRFAKANKLTLNNPEVANQADTLTK